MIQLRIFAPRLGSQISFTPIRSSNQASIARLFRQSLQKSLQRRCYAQPAARLTKVEEQIARQKLIAARSGNKQKLPESMLIYHAGTGRTTYIALVKITTLFMGAFFCFIVVPSYIKADQPAWDIGRFALCGILPIILVAFTTSPFVTHIYMHLPEHVRAGGPVLERFLNAVPPSTPLTLTTMSLIAKPRYSHVAVGDLHPVRRRLGIVNYERDAAEENAKRRWYNFRAVNQFYVQEKATRSGRRAKKEDKGLVKEWVWDRVKTQVGGKAQAVSAKDSVSRRGI